MEHACHKCGAAVEDGVPFCPQCGAPQIRVMVAAPPTATLPSSSTAEVASRPTTPAELGQPTWSQGWRAANLAAGLGALAALLVAMGTGLPQLGFLVWMAGGGMLAVMIYRRRQRLLQMNAATGARLGAQAGLMGFVIFGVLSLVQALALRGTGKLQAALEQALKASAARSGDPNAQKMIEQFLTPEGMRALLMLGIVLMLVLFVATSSLSGMLAAVLMGKKETRL
jgi:hypothetical protein